MRESIGNSFIFNLVLIFVAIIIALLVGSLSYSKAFKIKNQIISIIEKYETYNNSAVKSEINAFLQNIGYRTGNSRNNCADQSDGGYVLETGTNNQYRYCVYFKQTSKGYYYKVGVFMYFDIPFIGQYLEFPIYGETKTIYNL